MDYIYSVEGKARRYFKGAEQFFIEYPIDVSSCPLSILAVPFVTNFEPIAWFAGFDVKVPELDAQFFKSRDGYKACFTRMNPHRALKGKLVFERLTQNSISGDGTLMLFSGGLDAATTLIRNLSRNPILVLVRGADIDVADESKWAELSDHVKSQEFTRDRMILTITSNLRGFYNHLVDARVMFGWWGKVQHGGALLGILAPLNFVLNARTNFISSSYDIPMIWGSTKEADELLRWADVSCVHDAFGLSRQQKAQLVVDWSRSSKIGVKLRVCYSEEDRRGNCGRCEKCFRTIMNLVLSGADPREFGLPFDEKTYYNIMELMLTKDSSPGLVKFWSEISSKAGEALRSNTFFTLHDFQREKLFIEQVASGVIDDALRRNLSIRRQRMSLFRFRIRSELPWLYSLLRWVRSVFFISSNRTK